MERAKIPASAVLWRILLPAGKEPRKGQRRAFPRWTMRFPVLHGTETPTLVGLAADVNDEGLGFLTRVPYVPDSVIALQLVIPQGPIHVRALVRHCGNGIAGVQFLNISRRDRLALLDFCLGQAGHRAHDN